MGKVLVYIFNGMTDYEVSFISHILRTDVGKEVVTISQDYHLIRSSSGFILKPEYRVSEIDESEVEGLILCGGLEPHANQALLTLIQNLFHQKKLIAAIGEAGTLFLAQAGILSYVHYTTSIQSWDVNYQASFGKKDPFPRDNYLQKRLVRDQHVITAQKTVFIDFSVEVCSWFKLFLSQQEKQNFIKLLKRV